MLGLGWTEMLVIGLVALVFIGPRDLPVVMNRVGKMVGQIRRMGSEFQREINKTTGLDEVRNLRNSITAPLKKTTDEIRREFNAMTPTGVKPTGAIKPTDPNAESVVEEIRAQAGMAPTKPAGQAPAEAGFKPAVLAPLAVSIAKKAPAKAKAAPTRPVIATDLAALDAVPAPAEAKPILVDKPVRKPRPPKVVVERPALAAAVEPADLPAAKTPRTRAPRKTTTAKAGNE